MAGQADCACCTHAAACSRPAAAVTDTVQHVLGKPARDFESYVAAASWNPTIQHPIDPLNIAE
nr:hypothetical protein [Rhodococcus qingshengii]